VCSYFGERSLYPCRVNEILRFLKTFIPQDQHGGIGISKSALLSEEKRSHLIGGLGGSQGAGQESTCYPRGQTGFQVAVGVSGGRRFIRRSESTSRGGVFEKLCAGFRCFVACMLPVGVEKNKTNPSRKKNGPHGQ
jgi:hypothetical protein